MRTNYCVCAIILVVHIDTSLQSLALYEMLSNKDLFISMAEQLHVISDPAYRGNLDGAV